MLSTALNNDVIDPEAIHSRRTLVMGVLNVTPDSFSGDGLHRQPERAIEQGVQLVDQGADIVDIGGESTRPGHTDVTETEELDRVLPVIVGLATRGIRVSVDTRKATVADAAVLAGAILINDVSGRCDPQMLRVVANSNAHFVVVHAEKVASGRGAAETVLEGLQKQVQAARRAGIPPGQLWVDPGLGFCKEWRANLWIVQELQRLQSLGLPVLVGPSRKGTIAKVVGGWPNDRMEGGLALAALCIVNGAAVIRMHDVAPAVRMARMIDALRYPVEKNQVVNGSRFPGM